MHLKTVYVSTHTQTHTYICICIGSKASQLIYVKVFTCIFAHKGWIEYERNQWKINRFSLHKDILHKVGGRREETNPRRWSFLNICPVGSSYLKNQMQEHCSLQLSFRLIHKPSLLKALSKVNQSVWACPYSNLLQLLVPSGIAAPFHR